MAMTRSTGRLFAVVLHFAVLQGCGASVVTSADPDVEVASIEVSPGSVTFSSLGEAAQFAGVARDGSGSEIPGAALVWASDDPGVVSIGASGTASAVDNGTARVTATSGSVQGFADVVVAQVVDAVTPSQSSVSLMVGESLTVSAAADDALGSPVAGASITWTTSDESVASVDDDGLVLGEGVGSATVTATSGSASGDVSVTVGTTPPPQPTVLFEEGFEDSNLSGRGWYDFGAWVITNSEARSGNSSLELHYQQGAQQSNGGGGRHLFTETESVYLSYWVKYSSNWIGSGQSFNPHEFMLLTNADDAFTGPARTFLTFYVEQHNANGGNIPSMHASDGRNIDVNNINQDLTGVTEARAANGCNGSADGYVGACWSNGDGTYSNERSWVASQPYFMDAPGAGYKNDWHLVEAYVQLNSVVSGAGQTDGVVQYWFDGQLVLDYQDVLLRTGAHPTMSFDQLLIGPFIGAGSPIAQTWWIDDLVVGTARPGTP